MRPEENGRVSISNGYHGNHKPHTPKKVTHAVNGHTNGTHHPATNGTSKRRIHRSQSPNYRGHDREELTRILIQGLKDMGYSQAAQTLSSESGYELESPEVSSFRSAILSGRWNEAQRLLDGSSPSAKSGSRLVLAEGVHKTKLLFWIRQQKYLEALRISKNPSLALRVLREELAPLRYDAPQLHQLANLLMHDQDELSHHVRWQSAEESRNALLGDLTCSIAPSVMLREHRLSELLHQVKAAQINSCLYHNTATGPSLYADHTCSQESFPDKTHMVLSDHSNEVFCVAFSPDGSRLATAGQDQRCYIYDVKPDKGLNRFRVVQQLAKHSAPIVKLAWSPDSKYLITCAQERQARVWNVEEGSDLMVLEHNLTEEKQILSAAWLPSGNQFVTACMDKSAKINLWNFNPNPADRQSSPMPVNTWQGDFRVCELAVSCDGNSLVCDIYSDRDPGTLVVYNLNPDPRAGTLYAEKYRLSFDARITCITASRQHNQCIVSLSHGEVWMIDLAAGQVLRKFKGTNQNNMIIRNCYGGAAENFVLSGSRDGGVYIWHKENGQLIEILRGHGKGPSQETCVTSVSWNPQNPSMFASGGDDKKVRIWTSSAGDDHPAFDPRIRAPELGRVSSVRSTSNL